MVPCRDMVLCVAIELVVTENPAVHDKAKAHSDSALGALMTRRCAHDKLTHSAEAICHDKDFSVVIGLG